MAQQIPLHDESRAAEKRPQDGTHEVAPDIAYIRTIMVNVIFFGLPKSGDRGWVLIDAGVKGRTSAIRSVAEERFGRNSRPAAIILTHGHFDHVGALEELAEEWDVPVYAHPLEHPYLDGRASYPDGDPQVGGGAMASLSGFLPTHPVNVAGRLEALPEDGSVPFMPKWQWLHTPGHCPGHVSFWREADGALIAGDAVITTAAESAYATIFQTPELHGPPKYFTIDWQKSRASVETLARLKPRLLVTGHGRAMAGEEMAEALTVLARDFDSVAIPKHGRYVEKPATVEDRSAYVSP